MQKVLSYINQNKFYILAMIVIVVIGGVLNWYLINKPNLMNPTTQSANEISSSEPNQELNTLQQLIDVVGSHYVLPSGEEPLMATVGDKAKLPDQEFFKRAENGDKILIYKKAKKAFLYRPSLDKLLDVAPLNFEETSQASVQEAGIAGQKTDVFPKASGKVLKQTQE